MLTNYTIEPQITALYIETCFNRTVYKRKFSILLHSYWRALALAAKLSKFGSAGYRSPCFSHAKRALFHLSYTPLFRWLKHTSHLPVFSKNSKEQIAMYAIMEADISAFQAIAMTTASPAGNWTPVSRVTGGDTDHYTTEDIFAHYFTEISKCFAPSFVSKQPSWRLPRGNSSVVELSTADRTVPSSNLGAPSNTGIHGLSNLCIALLRS